MIDQNHKAKIYIASLVKRIEIASLLINLQFAHILVLGSLFFGFGRNHHKVDDKLHSITS